MTDALKYLKNCVNDASPEALLMSKKNCHAANISSIVLRRSPFGGFSRVFLAWPGHKLLNNNLYGDMVVGIHNHRYDIFLRHIHGYILNTTYEETEKYGVELNKWKFSSGVVSGTPKIEHLGKVSLQENQTVQLEQHTLTVRLDASEFHDISCGPIAAWWVHEGMDVRETTTLFTKSGEPNMTGLYDSFNDADEVKAHVNEFISLCS